MFPDSSPDDDTDAHTRPTADGGGETYLAVVVEYDDEPDECTIFPAGVSGEQFVTTWISAGGDAFVALDDAR